MQAPHWCPGAPPPALESPPSERFSRSHGANARPAGEEHRESRARWKDKIKWPRISRAPEILLLHDAGVLQFCFAWKADMKPTRTLSMRADLSQDNRPSFAYHQTPRSEFMHKHRRGGHVSTEHAFRLAQVCHANRHVSSWKKARRNLETA